MKIAIHAGMAKTGTSSIQKTLWTLGQNSLLPSGTEYALGLGGWNHSHNLINSFEGNNLRAFGRLLEFLHTESPLKIMSAEVISNPGDRGEVVRQGLKKAIGSIGAEVDLDLYLYVRAPRSFMTSLFAQMLKMGIRRDEGREFSWPCYRRRIEGVRSLSDSSGPQGKASLKLCPFKKSLLAGEDVVVDFLKHVGISIDPRQVVSINESLSTEAISILYLENLERVSSKKARGMTSSPLRHQILVDFLSDIGASRLCFAPSVFSRYVDPEDLEWGEEQVGCSLDEPGHPADAITLEELRVTGKKSLGLLNEKAVEKGIVSRSELSLLTVSGMIERIIAFYQPLCAPR